jgi:predicted negative regulator of RcsB-dependent stress response
MTACVCQSIDSPTTFQYKPDNMKNRTPIFIALMILIAASLACNLPGLTQPQDSGSSSSPTETLSLETLLSTQTPTRVLPTPTLTPQPEVRIDQGDRALFLGQNDLAQSEYQSAYQQSSDPQVQAAAQLGTARVQLQAGDIDLAIATLQQVTSQFSDTDAADDAYYFLAQAAEENDDPAARAAYLQAYLAQGSTPIDVYLQVRLGDLLMAAGNPNDAISAYESASQDAEYADDESLKIKSGRPIPAYRITAMHCACSWVFTMPPAMNIPGQRSTCWPGRSTWHWACRSKLKRASWIRSTITPVPMILTRHWSIWSIPMWRSTH